MSLTSLRPGRPFRGRNSRLVATLLLSAPLLSAQPAQSPDEDWRQLQALLGRDSAPSVANARTPAERGAARQQRAARLQQAAIQAREFHNRNGSDPKAPLARKAEVMALLESARLGSEPAAVVAALSLATAYRADFAHLREHRFEVALAAERLRQLQATGPHPPHADEALADSLLREFGPIPEIHGLFAGLAARAEMVSANRLATRLLEMRPPAGVRKLAEAITARYGLVGRPLGLRLTRLDATTFELPANPAPAGPTVLYVWTPGHSPAAGPFAALAPLRGKLPTDVRWIYIGTGIPVTAVRAAASRAPFAGTHCQDDAGPRSALAQRLNVTTSPTVFVLNRQGVLTGIGRAEDLPALLAAAAR